MESEQLQLPLDDERRLSKPCGRFRKIPTETSAVQLCWRTWSEMCDLLGSALGAENAHGARNLTEREGPVDTCGEDGPFLGLWVRTEQDQQVFVRHGEWILPDKTEGRFYPVHPEVFAISYERV